MTVRIQSEFSQQSKEIALDLINRNASFNFEIQGIDGGGVFSVKNPNRLTVAHLASAYKVIEKVEDTDENRMRSLESVLESILGDECLSCSNDQEARKLLGWDID